MTAPARSRTSCSGYRVHVKGTDRWRRAGRAQVEDSEHQHQHGPQHQRHRLAFPGTIAAFQFTVDGRLVKGDATTEFFGNSAFSDLVNGARVEVKGSQRDGFVYATRMKSK